MNRPYSWILLISRESPDKPPPHSRNYQNTSYPLRLSEKLNFHLFIFADHPQQEDKNARDIY
jgi:hypothetical protein